MKIASKQEGIKVKSAYPSFNYRFDKVDEYIEVLDEHAIKILKNPLFYSDDKSLNKEKQSKKSKLLKGDK